MDFLLSCIVLICVVLMIAIPLCYVNKHYIEQQTYDNTDNLRNHIIDVEAKLERQNEKLDSLINILEENGLLDDVVFMSCEMNKE